MNRPCKILIGCVVAVLTAGQAIAQSEPPKKEARVTQIIRDVKLLSFGSPARPAVANDQVREGTGVRTGDESRSELTFEDLMITRLGANTIFSFNKAGRDGHLGSGSVLLYVPKDSGGAEFRTSAVTVGVTGTTFIFEGTRAGRSKLIMLEGAARLALVKFTDQFKDVRAGQMLNVKAGAKKLPEPEDVDLDRIMKKHPLITDFPPLPSQDLILAVVKNQQGAASGGPPVITSTPTPTPGQTGIFTPTPLSTPTPRVLPTRTPPPRPRPTPRGISTPTPKPTATPKQTPRPTPRSTPTPKGNVVRPPPRTIGPTKKGTPTPSPSPKIF